MLQGTRLRQLRRKAHQPMRGGFSLVEVMVVLAILVILFGLLFAPMMAGMEMVASGRTQARMQDAARQAAEQMQRELSEAMYVYPQPTLTISGGVVTDYSQIVFVGPAKDPATGALLTPKRPRTDSASGEVLVTRYYVRPPDVTGGKIYNDANPFVLVRQEGLYHLGPSTGQYVFGSYDPKNGDAWTPGLAIAENALTPRTGYDIPATTTICLDCHAMEVGYLDVCKNTSCGGTNLAYLHRDVQFMPERVVGEPLVASQDNTTFTARYGNWMGTANNGTTFLGGSALSATESELQPRIVVYRWNTTVTAPDEPSFTTIALDTFSAVRNNIALRWNSASGEVRIGNTHTVHISVDLASAPAAGAGTFWPLTIDGDSYDATGTLSGAATAAATPVYPKAPTEWGEPRMPIAFVLEPGRSDGATLVAAKLVPQSTQVVIVATAGTDARRGDYTRVENSNQSTLGANEYCEYLYPDHQGGEIRFNRYQPPSPDSYSGLTAYDIYITYTYRRNFDPSTGKDDVVYADYSTGEIINVTLIPQRFTDLENYQAGQPNLVVPADQAVGGVPVHLKAVIRNARR